MILRSPLSAIGFRKPELPLRGRKTGTTAGLRLITQPTKAAPHRVAQGFNLRIGVLQIQGKDLSERWALLFLRLDLLQKEIRRKYRIKNNNTLQIAGDLAGLPVQTIGMLQVL
ncbi:hypothetical protein D3C80_1807550 [compost metagenome]